MLSWKKILRFSIVIKIKFSVVVIECNKLYFLNSWKYLCHTMGSHNWAFSKGLIVQSLDTFPPYREARLFRKRRQSDLVKGHWNMNSIWFGFLKAQVSPISRTTHFTSFEFPSFHFHLLLLWDQLALPNSYTKSCKSIIAEFLLTSTT